MQIMKLLGFMSVAFPIYGIEVRHLAPPKLSVEHLGTRKNCRRAVRQHGPRIDIEYRGEKIIAHNFGHGGAGWTLAPGSAQLIVKKLMQEVSDISEPITVLGAGALGLFTAVELTLHGFYNITIVADQFDGLTSHNAGGLFMPTFVEPTQASNDILRASFITYAQIAQKKHSFLTGARFMPFYRSTHTTKFDQFIGRGMQPGKDVIVDFDNGTQKSMVVYDDCIFMDVEMLMQEMTNFLTEYGVMFETAHIASLDDVEADIVVNCAGLGANELVDDEHVVPMHGHLIMLKNQNPEGLDYIMAADYSENDDSRFFCFLPKRSLSSTPDEIGVIGGTFMSETDTRATDYLEFESVIEQAKEFLGITDD